MLEKKTKLYSWLILLIMATAISAVIVIVCGVKLLTAYGPVFIAMLPITVLWIAACIAVAIGLICIKVVDELIGDTKYREKYETESMIFRSAAK